MLELGDEEGDHAIGVGARNARVDPVEAVVVGGLVGAEGDRVDPVGSEREARVVEAVHPVALGLDVPVRGSARGALRVAADAGARLDLAAHPVELGHVGRILEARVLAADARRRRRAVVGALAANDITRGVVLEVPALLGAARDRLPGADLAVRTLALGLARERRRALERGLDEDRLVPAAALAAGPLADGLGLPHPAAEVLTARRLEGAGRRVGPVDERVELEVRAPVEGAATEHVLARAHLTGAQLSLRAVAVGADLLGAPAGPEVVPALARARKEARVAAAVVRGLGLPCRLGLVALIALLACALVAVVSLLALLCAARVLVERAVFADARAEQQQGRGEEGHSAVGEGLHVQPLSHL